MQRNWLMRYSNSKPRPQRFDEPENYWLDLQDSLNRWGGSKTWQQLHQLGRMVKTNWHTGSLCVQRLAGV